MLSRGSDFITDGLKPAINQPFAAAIQRLWGEGAMGMHNILDPPLPRKNVRSKKIGQTNQKMIHFVPNMYVSGKISALRPGTQTVMIFGATKKSENYLKQRDFRICGFLRFFGVFFFFGFFCGVAGFIPSRLMRCKHFLAFVSPNKKTCNIMQSKP